MFIEGTVKTYNTDRGFGFIQCEDNRKDIFFHISDFPNKHQPPQIGERLKFYVDQNDGKPRAKNIFRLDLNNALPENIGKAKSTKRKAQKDKGFNLVNLFIGAAMIAIFISFFIPFISGIFKRETLKRESVNTNEPVRSTPTTSSTNVKSIYRCDGRTHCSQMKSYEEAVYFINNCPGTEMDGDGDGEPCERQF